MIGERDLGYLLHPPLVLIVEAAAAAVLVVVVVDDYVVDDLHFYVLHHGQAKVQEC